MKYIYTEHYGGLIPIVDESNVSLVSHYLERQTGACGDECLLCASGCEFEGVDFDLYLLNNGYEEIIAIVR